MTDLETALKEQIAEWREQAYDETVKRLLGDSHGSLWTEQELYDMIDRRIEEHTRR